MFAFYSKPLFRYTLPGVYMLCTVAVQAGSWICLKRYGVSSPQYFHFYYYTDSLLTIALFFVIIQLYQWIFIEMSIGRYIRSTASVLLAATAFFSYLVIHQNRDHMTTQFVVEFGQNLYFVGVVLTYLLWGAMLKLSETRTRWCSWCLRSEYISARTQGLMLSEISSQIWSRFSCSGSHH